MQLALGVLGLATALSIELRPAKSQASGSANAAPAAAEPGQPGAAPPSGSAAAEPPVEPAAENDDGDGDGSGRPVSAMPVDPAERARWLTRELDAAVAGRAGLAGAKLGAIAVDLATGATLWQHQADVPLSLASTTKLFTGAAALHALGPGYLWRTAFYGEEAPGASAAELRDDTIDVLYLRGRGDPTLDLSNLRALATDLADRGIRRIRKEIVLDTTFFDDALEPPHFDEQPKERAAFRAPVSALSLARNSVVVIATADADGASPPRVRLEPPVDELFRVVADELVTTPDGKTRVRIDVVPKPGKNAKLELRLSGQLAAGGPPFYRRIRIDDPVAFVGAALRQALDERGIRAPSRVTLGAVPNKAKLLVAYDGPPLAEVVRRMNKTSDNFLAEVVFKTLGAATRAAAGPATWADGAAAVQRYVGGLGLAGSVRLDNGSGLFDASAASPAQLAHLLAAAARDFRVAPDFIASLPVGGVDGTLQGRFEGRPAAGLVRAKTGTLAQVSALAGYVGVESQRLVAFAVLVNGLAPQQRREARALQEDLIDVLALYLGAPAATPAPPPAVTPNGPPPPPASGR